MRIRVIEELPILDIWSRDAFTHTFVKTTQFKEYDFVTGLSVISK